MNLGGKIFLTGLLSFALTLPYLWTIGPKATPHWLVAALVVLMFWGGLAAMVVSILMAVWL